MGDRVPNPTLLGGLKSDLRTLKKNAKRAQAFSGAQYGSDDVQSQINDLSARISTLESRIFTSPGGTQYRLGVSDAGATTWTAV